MTGRSRRTRFGLGLAALVVAALPLSAVPASAGGLLGDTSPQPIVADRVERQESAGTCRMYGSANGYGMVCTDPTGGSGRRSLVSYLEGTPPELPRCWDESAPAGYRGPPQTGDGAFWLRTCVDGLDLRTLARTGPLRLDFTILWLPPGEERELTEGEEVVVRYFFGRGQIPFPVTEVSPWGEPRVEERVSFSLYDPFETAPITTAGVTMYATVVQLQVDPGDGSDLITCQGPGEKLTAEELADDARAGAPTVCSHAYERSSVTAGAVGPERDRYPARVTAFWEIRYSTPGEPEQVLGTYEKVSVNQIRVTEVQTLVVS